MKKNIEEVFDNELKSIDINKKNEEKIFIFLSSIVHFFSFSISIFYFDEKLRKKYFFLFSKLEKDIFSLFEKSIGDIEQSIGNNEIGISLSSPRSEFVDEKEKATEDDDEPLTRISFFRCLFYLLKEGKQEWNNIPTSSSLPNVNAIHKDHVREIYEDSASKQIELDVHYKEKIDNKLLYRKIEIKKRNDYYDYLEYWKVDFHKEETKKINILKSFLTLLEHDNNIDYRANIPQKESYIKNWNEFLPKNSYLKDNCLWLVKTKSFIVYFFNFLINDLIPFIEKHEQLKEKLASRFIIIEEKKELLEELFKELFKEIKIRTTFSSFKLEGHDRDGDEWLNFEVREIKKYLDFIKLIEVSLDCDYDYYEENNDFKFKHYKEEWGPLLKIFSKEFHSDLFDFIITIYIDKYKNEKKYIDESTILTNTLSLSKKIINMNNIFSFDDKLNLEKKCYFISDNGDDKNSERSKIFEAIKDWEYYNRYDLKKNPPSTSNYLYYKEKGLKYWLLEAESLFSKSESQKLRLDRKYEYYKLNQERVINYLLLQREKIKSKSIEDEKLKIIIDESFLNLTDSEKMKKEIFEIKRGFLSIKYLKMLEIESAIFLFKSDVNKKNKYFNCQDSFSIPSAYHYYLNEKENDSNDVDIDNKIICSCPSYTDSFKFDSNFEWKISYIKNFLNDYDKKNRIDEKKNKITKVINELSLIKQYFSLELDKKNDFGKIYWHLSWWSSVTSIITIFSSVYIFSFSKKKRHKKIISILEFVISCWNLISLIIFFSIGFYSMFPKGDLAWDKFYLFGIGMPRIYYYLIYQICWHLIAPSFFIIHFLNNHDIKCISKNKKKALYFSFISFLSYHFFVIIRPFICSFPKNVIKVGNLSNFVFPTYPMKYFFWIFGITSNNVALSENINYLDKFFLPIFIMGNLASFFVYFFLSIISVEILLFIKKKRWRNIINWFKFRWKKILGWFKSE